jgi:sugar phosphate isomerase/epimerase
MNVRQGFTVEGDVDAGTAVAFAAERGFDFVELNMENGFPRGRVERAARSAAERASDERSDPRAPDAIRSLAAEHDVALLVHLPYRIDPGSPHEHAREGACRELEAAIDVAADMGAEAGVVHATSWAHPDAWDHGVLRQCIYDSVRRLDAYGREQGVEVVVENLKAPFFDAGDFPDLFEATDANACLDTGHALVSGLDAVAQAALLREHGDRIAHLHLNESRRTDEDEHLPVGIGRIDFGVIAETIRETDWTGTCTHEVFGFDREFVALGKRNFDALLAGE